VFVVRQLASRAHRRSLQRLTVDTEADAQQVEDSAVSEPLPELVPSPFLPQLIILQLTGDSPAPQPFVSSVLRQFTAPPYAELRHVAIYNDYLTAQNVLSLSSLPRLSFLQAVGNQFEDGEDS
jgi:hypothetical protein